MDNKDKSLSTSEPGRYRLLHRIEAWLELPMVLLGFVWLALLVAELVIGLTPTLQNLSLAIWALFVVDFVLRLVIAPHKLAYLRTNWLTAVALAVPALRAFRIARAVRLLRLARTARGIQLVRVLGSLNRGMNTLAVTMARRGFGYIVLLTLIVVVVGSAAMYAFEQSADGEGLSDYSTALWWTAMLMTTMGTEYWPRTAEGRVLCLVMSVYAFAVFGYVTATIARFFIAQDAKTPQGAAAASGIQQELTALREQVKALTDQLRNSNQINDL